jgi:hypothetical protein
MTKQQRTIILAFLLGVGVAEIWNPTFIWAVGEFLTHPQVMSRVSLRF